MTLSYWSTKHACTHTLQPHRLQQQVTDFFDITKAIVDLDRSQFAHIAILQFINNCCHIPLDGLHRKFSDLQSNQMIAFYVTFLHLWGRIDQTNYATVGLCEDCGLELFPFIFNLDTRTNISLVDIGWMHRHLRGVQFAFFRLQHL